MGQDIATPIHLNIGCRKAVEIYKPQVFIDYEYTDPAEPFGDTSKAYPQLMYPELADGICTSMVAGAA